MAQQYYADATADPESLLPETMESAAPAGVATGDYEQYIDDHTAGDANNNEDYIKEMEEERQQALAAVPEDVKKFIGAFHQAILGNDSAQISAMYEGGWNRLTQQYYAESEWPEAELLAPLVGGDQVFLTLYRELYFRHVYAKLEPNVDDRFQSYENICELFNLLLNSEEPVALDLPIQWLWDMLDEFVYQFQSFTAWRADIASKSSEEQQLLADNPQIWSCYSVLNVLYSLVQRSAINEQLAAEHAGSSAEEVAQIAGPYGSKPLYRNLGYFSLICLLRVHLLIGDPTLALQTLSNVHLSSEALFTKITACHVSTYYHVGFAYMSLGRFPDAVKAFVGALIYFNRMKSFHTRSYQYGSISRQCDRMYALLAICTTLAPGPVDEGTMSAMREKYGEQLLTMQRGGEDALPVYRELYLSAAPKFLSPIAPPYETPDQLSAYASESEALDPHTRHADLFLSGVHASLSAPTMRSFLKLYTTIDAKKLASFMDEDEDDVLEKMMVLKSANRTFGSREGAGGSLLDGERMVVGNLDFTINGDAVSVAETTTNKRYAGYFIRNAEHAQRVLETIRAAPLPITRPAGQSVTTQGDAKSGAAGQRTAAGGARGGAPVTGARAGQTAKAGGAAGRTSGNPWAR
ncbi:hypothetical protein QFC22_006161 [Naganishia vaughanmartiniae]|uniref:Uncharacterized protein n=1 Tax=Naganishia vaughanmartiniae TaxID=1424756 RepID=A0ACC2WMR4_9TREE|nr:hypothetical protein QFC22_006161 [Naganishia vaughanmartiniae]